MADVGKISSKSFRSRLRLTRLGLGLAALVAVTVCTEMLATAQLSRKNGVFGPQERATAFVLGRAIDASSKQPIAGARVSLVGRDGGRGQETVLTNSGGYFLFRDLAAGSYTIAANASGYLSGGFGQRAPGGRTQPLAVAAGQRLGDVTIALWKAANLSGTVTDERGDPVPALAVSLLTPGHLAGRGPSRADPAPNVAVAHTDAAGAYQFSSLLPGEYVVSIASRTTQVPVSLADADERALETVRATGTAALTSGLRSLGPPIVLAGSLIQTSSEGYWGGSNSLAARLPLTMRADGTVVGYPATFFPSATTPVEAAVIPLAVGEERTNVHIQLRPVALTRISGRLSGPGGALAGWSVHLFPAFAVDSDLERSHIAGTTVTRGDGAFAFLGVPAGRYVVKAWRLPQSSAIGTNALPSEPTLWGRAVVDVSDRPVTGLDISVQPGAAVRGRIVLDGTAPQLPPVRFQTLLSVAFEPGWSLAFGARLATRVSASLEFETQGLPPGRYPPALPNNFTVPGWYFESASRAGRDLMRWPLVLEPAVDADDLVLVFSDRRTTLTGTVVDGAGRPPQSGAVVVFPADSRSWIDQGLPSRAAFEGAIAQTGVFALDVRPGEYLVAAIDEGGLDTWRREAVVTALAMQATRVTVTRGDNTIPALRLSPIKGPRP